jgi:hypothetical protein
MYLLRYDYEREVSQGIIQTLTLVAVSSFGESLRWVPHHPSGGSHLNTIILFRNLSITTIDKDYFIGRITEKVVPRGDDSDHMRP